MSNIKDCLKPLEKKCNNLLTPVLHFEVSEPDRKVIGLPVRYGGMGIFVPTQKFQLINDKLCMLTKHVEQKYVELFNKNELHGINKEQLLAKYINNFRSDDEQMNIEALVI